MQASQICLLSSRIAKGGAGMVTMAGQFLNLVLEDLKLNRDLKVNRVTQSISVGPLGYGPYPLEGNYLRTYDLFYPLPTSTGSQTTGLTQFLNPVTMEQWDSEFKDISISNYPYEFATDLSTQAQVWSGGVPGVGTCTQAGVLFIYPLSSGIITLTHRYMVNQPDMLSPESNPAAPWFAFTKYLIHATAAELMGVTGDDRESTFRAECEAMLRPHLIMEGDEQSTVREVKLDPRRFHFSKGLKPTKASPY